MTRPNAYHPAAEDLFAYRDGELPADKRSLVEAHVLACATCREKIDELSAMESDLKLRSDPVGDAYYERMAESVLARVGAAEPPVPAAATARPAAAPERAPVDRRRPEGEDFERPRRSFRLPWIGIAGTGAAAVAVVLVVVMLLQRQEEWVSAPRPSVDMRARGVGDSSWAEAPSSGPEVGAAGEGAGARRDAAASRAGKDDAAKNQLRTEPRPETAQSGAAAPVSEKKLATSGTAADAREETSSPAPEVQFREATEPDATLRAKGAAPSPPASAPSEAYAQVLRAHRLPVVWDPGVSKDALLAAESDLRYIYQNGRAGAADSARIRLYLAEAARLKLEDPPDPAALEEIAHHYRRAISLAGSDAAVAAAARRRLATLFPR